MTDRRANRSEVEKKPENRRERHQEPARGKAGGRRAHRNKDKEEGKGFHPRGMCRPPEPAKQSIWGLILRPGPNSFYLCSCSQKNKLYNRWVGLASAVWDRKSQRALAKAGGWQTRAAKLYYGIQRPFLVAFHSATRLRTSASWPVNGCHSCSHHKRIPNSRKDEEGHTLPLLQRLSRIITQHFHIKLMGQNLLTWSHLVARSVYRKCVWIHCYSE